MKHRGKNKVMKIEHFSLNLSAVDDPFEGIIVTVFSELGQNDLGKEKTPIIVFSYNHPIGYDKWVGRDDKDKLAVHLRNYNANPLYNQFRTEALAYIVKQVPSFRKKDTSIEDLFFSSISCCPQEYETYEDILLIKLWNGYKGLFLKRKNSSEEQLICFIEEDGLYDPFSYKAGSVTVAVGKLK